ncbi:HNH endonuclease signature motif containing protein [Microbacterium paludicola]|uniref:HNH endonuclease signature motif containing protein n=1 Tax=Microbacterium paludicola TaxID=300019 RepID=UPI001F2B9AE0|nr:HNH endonuclease signature motif containing protein [Microbacterium paludicola]
MEVSPHAHAIAAYGETLALVHYAEVASVRALAELGRSALREAQRDGVRGMASDMELRSVAAEAAGLARRTDRRLQADIDHALTVVDDYPTVFAAWEQRRITRDHIEVVVKAGTGLPDEVRGEFEIAAIAVCERDIATRVKPALRDLAERLHERTFTDRHREAAAGRCVRVSHGADGMSDLIATLPTVIAAGILDRITQMGQSVKDARVEAAGAVAGPSAEGLDAAGASVDADAAPDVRTMDQLRADILSDLVLSGAPVVDPTYGTDRAGGLGAIRARVQVAVTAETLTGRDERPAEAVGAGLIDAETAREVARQGSEWDRLFIDPVTRTPVEIDTYRPTAAMKKLVMARDQHCRFPGCRRAAIRCELDHTIDYALGGQPMSTTLRTSAKGTTR